MSRPPPRVLPYGGWPSAIPAESLVAGVVGLSELRTDGRALYWLESRPEEAGRTVLVRWHNGRAEDLTPAPHNVRSRVHEYGGGAYTLCTDGGACFVDFADQNLYRVDPGGGILQVTRSDARIRLADFVPDEGRNRLICVVEDHRPQGEPENFLGAVDLASGELSVLARGHHFYAAPRLSPDGTRLAFIAWDHPNMPWDGTVLQTARLDGDGDLHHLTTVAGGAAESVSQPVWQADGSLLFISDRTGFWNLHRFDGSGIWCLLEEAVDHAEPAWVFGSGSYALLKGDHVLLARQGERAGEAVLVDTRSGLASNYLGEETPWSGYAGFCVLDGHLHFIGSYPDRSATIERVPLAGGAGETLREAGGPALAAGDVSLGQAMAYPTRDGAQAHAWFYPPANARVTGPPDERPPLLVMSHGGPTAAAGRSLNLRIQYYTNRGWAVLDVNYRGSTGYGRTYRQALNGRWGEVDVTDCEDAVRHLAHAGRIDPQRVAIRGGSAGGYTTLRALTTTSTFRAGASHYGIGDLHALARDTHKFESRYLDGLLGSPEALSERSPINHLDRFNCPVIFFQGSEDAVVPAGQSQAMVDALRRQGIPVAYLEFPGEGHGFRDAANIVRAAASEYGFFCRVFGITPAETLPEIVIRNAGKR